MSFETGMNAGGGLNGGTGMIAIRDGKLLTITRGTIDSGIILIKGSRIQAIGQDFEIPSGVQVIDAAGMMVTPGLIDAHSHLGIFGEPHVWANQDGNEKTDPITPHLRAIDSLNPADPGFPEVLAAGITTIYTGPGSANIVGGTGMAIKTFGRTAEEMVIPGTEAMKMALGENPKRVYGAEKKQAPQTRMGNAAALREALVRAANYLEKVERAHEECEPGKRPKLPERDLRLEALGRVLRREMKARIHAHRTDDILTAVRVAEEFNLDFTIEHATEGYRIADLLAQKGVRCVVGPLTVARHKMELSEVTLRNPGLLARAGVKVAIQVDGFSATRWLPIHAGLAVREGMPEPEAFRAITINAAEILGLQDRLGSLEPEKDADIAIFDGNPMSTRTKCRMVLIQGRVVYRRAD